MRRRMPLIWALDWARAHPELRDQGAPGTELFPALLDLMAGRIDVYFSNAGVVMRGGADPHAPRGPGGAPRPPAPAGGA